MDSRRLRPKSVGGTAEMVTTEWRLPPAVGLAFCESVARNSTSLGLRPPVSPPTSDRRRTWLAVMPSVIWSEGSECFRRCCMSGKGQSRYGLTGESGSESSLLDRFVPPAGSQPPMAPSKSSPSSGACDSSTTIRGSWVLRLKTGVNEERRILTCLSLSGGYSGKILIKWGNY